MKKDDVIIIKRCPRGSSQILSLQEYWQDSFDSGNKWFKANKNATLEKYMDWASIRGEECEDFELIAHHSKD